ncbi:MAG: 1-deoxy-D-xylulose-5-phosphate synthase [Nitrospiraceae bacterium]|nr:1-deoxy-D-xylulose-5-phosphate synthase [Nitrospiraceae bacterium]
MYLEGIDSPKDLKGLSEKELEPLAAELREFIIKHVSVCGGHLASNLGVVELTLALHYVFDSPADKIVWDVGHQSYTHKILTGRKDRFGRLRKMGGLTGFTRPEESEHDAFIAGHSSTSISAAVGLIEARDKLHEDYKVIAVIGDGSLTAGLAFEGLNHAGHLRKDLIVVLNDNEMSISKNVGALSSYLNRILTGEFYRRFKSSTKDLINIIPRVGPQVAKLAQKLEETVKGFVLPGVIFEELGFNYLGPIDGHDIKQLVDTFRSVREATTPTLIHVVTKKGKGYAPSEENPCVFHGVGPFEVETGQPLSNSVSMSEYFGSALIKCAEDDGRVIAISAAMKEGTGLARFEEKFPDRFYDVGIAEPHAVVFSAALAKGGMKPVLAIYSTFLQRGYDELIHDVCLQRLPVVFAIDRAGVVGEDGPTHHGMYDLSYLRHIPGLTVMAPKDAPELEKMLRFALSMSSPVAIRYPRGKAETVGGTPAIERGKAELLKEGRDIAVLAIGGMAAEAMAAVEALEALGISAVLYNMRFVKPMDKEAVRSAARTGRIITVEDNSVVGGFGSAVAEVVSAMGIEGVKLRSIGFPDIFIEHGSQAELRAKYGIGREGICKAARKMMEDNAAGEKTARDLI